MSTGSLVVGIHAVEAVLRSDPKRVDKMLCTQARRDKRLVKLLDLARNQGVQVEIVEREEIDELCGHKKHQSVLAYYQGVPERTESHLLTDLHTKTRPWLILILDEVQDPHNLGACLRSADCFAVDAVVIPRDNSVSVTPVVQKVAAGGAATIPVYRVTNLVRALNQLQEADVWLYGAAGESDKSLYDYSLSGSIGLILGAEGSGLRKLTRDACDQLYKIPLYGQVSSLNVSVAAGISLSEVMRQRYFIEK